MKKTVSHTLAVALLAQGSGMQGMQYVQDLGSRARRGAEYGAGVATAPFKAGAGYAMETRAGQAVSALVAPLLVQFGRLLEAGNTRALQPLLAKYRAQTKGMQRGIQAVAVLTLLTALGLIAKAAMARTGVQGIVRRLEEQFPRMNPDQLILVKAVAGDNNVFIYRLFKAAEKASVEQLKSKYIIQILEALFNQVPHNEFAQYVLTFIITKMKGIANQNIADRVEQLKEAALAEPGPGVARRAFERVKKLPGQAVGGTFESIYGG